MRDEIDGRMWTEHRQAFGDSVARFFDEVGVSLQRLNQIQFEAPWRAAKARQRPH